MPGWKKNIITLLAIHRDSIQAFQSISRSLLKPFGLHAPPPIQTSNPQIPQRSVAVVDRNFSSTRQLGDSYLCRTSAKRGSFGHCDCHVCKHGSHGFDPAHCCLTNQVPTLRDSCLGRKRVLQKQEIQNLPRKLSTACREQYSHAQPLSLPLL